MKNKMPRTPFSTPLSGSARETEIRIRNIFSGPKQRPPLPFLILVFSVCIFCGNLVSCQMAEEGGETSSLPDLNAQVNVFLSKDCLSAWLLICPPVGGGKEVKWAALDMALAGQEIRFGINEELLNAIPKDPERYFKLFPVARGIPAARC